MPNPDYVVPRWDLVLQAADELEQVECLLIHSRIGNGKTIFLHILSYVLSQRGYRCVWVRPNALLLPEDLEILGSMNNVVVFFDSYSVAVDFIRELQGVGCSKFVVAVRTAVQEVRLHEIQSALPDSFGRVSLNGLTGQERKHFSVLLDKSGVRARELERVIDSARDFRDVVVSLYGHTEIKKKISEEFGPLLEDTDFKTVFAVIHILTWIGEDVEAGFVRSVTNKDSYAALAKYRATTGDVFSLDDDNISVRSPLFAEYLIQHHLTTEDVMEGVYAILTHSVRRKAERRYRAILSGLMRTSVLQRAVNADPDHFVSLEHLFERLAQDSEMNREPLFWLQYCILMTQADNLQLAEGFLRTAYSRAADSIGFRTFQIDTFALKLFLMIEQHDQEGSRVQRLEEILQKVNEVREMIGDTSRRYHAIQVFGGHRTVRGSAVSGAVEAGEGRVASAY